VRSAAPSAWQVVYEAEGLTVDLRFGHRAQSKRFTWLGQTTSEPCGSGRATQTLRCRQNWISVVATTTVTAMGEFHIEFKPQDRLWLSVKAAGAIPCAFRSQIRDEATNMAYQRNQNGLQRLRVGSTKVPLKTRTWVHDRKGENDGCNEIKYESSASRPGALPAVADGLARRLHRRKLV
jgi:hypothetical protein